MAYYTYRLFRGISLARLRAKAEANLALYEPGAAGRQVGARLYEGRGCSAMLLGTLNREDEVFVPVGHQFGCVWMDVRYQDGDWWDLTVYEGLEHRVSHDVNPWAHEDRVEYNQDHIDFRIRRVCELWPEQSGGIERYLLLWRVPATKLGRTRYVRREGKAYEADECGYGDASQINDFVRAFGIGESSISVEIDALA
ncbi:MAG: hypothetical protein U0746_09605 [Gemmataceae bacterium]